VLAECPAEAEKKGRTRCPALLSLGYICSLRTFLAFSDFKLYLVSLLQAFVAFGTDRAVVNKYVWPICAPDEPVSFRVIEPLYGSFQSIHEEPLLHVLPRA